MASVELEDKELKKRIKEISQGLGKTAPLFRAIAELETSSTLLRYVDQVSPLGKKWDTPKTRRRDGMGGTRPFSSALGDKILQDTGMLMASIGAVYGEDFAEVGTNVKYGKFLQEGRFPFLGINEETRENITEAFEMFMQGLLR